MSGKMALRFQGRDIDALKAVANAYNERSLKEFEHCVNNYAQGNIYNFYCEQRTSK